MQEPIFFRSLWGVKNSEWETYFPALRSQGINGIEGSLSDIGLAVDGGERFFSLIQKHEMKWICGLYSGWIDYIGEEPDDSQDVSKHLVCLKTQISTLMQLSMKPYHINCHAGSDRFSRSESLTFFKDALSMIKILDSSLSFETHRGRILYNPWIALDLVQEIPDLRFTLDLSHWVVVAERLIPIKALDPILIRTQHIHARIGTPQSSQVSNPSRMDQHVREYFESVWKRVLTFSTCSKNSLCLEYGPFDEGGYQPLVKKSDLNEWISEMPLEDLIATEAKRLHITFLDIMRNN